MASSKASNTCLESHLTRPSNPHHTSFRVDSKTASEIDIQTGTSNCIYAGGGDNLYANDGEHNLLSYVDTPRTALVNLATEQATNGFDGTDTIKGFTWVEAGSGATLIAGEHDATLSIYGDNGIVKGGDGNDLLFASGAGNTLEAGKGSDILHTTGADDTYVIGDGSPVPDFTEIKQEWIGATGTLDFMSETLPAEIWLSADAAGDLVVTPLGTGKTIMLDNWFSGSNNQLASIATKSGSIDNGGINMLEQAMASYQSSNAAFDPTSAGSMPSDPTLTSAFMAAWRFS